ncbi:hypothetical protein [Cupriavidus sp. USMAA2-4]|uniref:hypothetical protein n=1 Tax=Cupriavidus sp. USMAA2-4 TaxID=876364 RepID=UPI0018DE2DCA|nr:hypothetical protein [Cupriavidus sp. USMAA2-4]
MRIGVEVTPAELQEMGADSADELKLMLIEQIDEGVVGDDGEAGADWLSGYTVDVFVQ